MSTIELNHRKYVILDQSHLMKKISLEAIAVYAMLNSIETNGMIDIVDHSQELLEIESQLEKEGLSFYEVIKELEEACVIEMLEDGSSFKFI